MAQYDESYPAGYEGEDCEEAVIGVISEDLKDLGGCPRDDFQFTHLGIKVGTEPEFDAVSVQRVVVGHWASWLERRAQSADSW